MRKVKTDKRDSISIANYGIEKWFTLRPFDCQEGVYAELKLLGRQYRFFMESRIELLLNLTHLLDYTSPVSRLASEVGVSTQERISYAILQKNTGIMITSRNVVKQNLSNITRNGQRKKDTIKANQKPLKSTDSLRMASLQFLLTHLQLRC